MTKKGGFTLIEVMTVILIIAILASVVLVSLQAARDRTRDVTIQNQLGQLRSLAETLYSFEAGYEDFTQEGHDDNSRYLLVKKQVNDMNNNEAFEFHVSGHYYCGYAQLVRNEEEYFCVDSTGDALVTEDISMCNGVTNFFCRVTGSVGGCVEDGDCPMGQICVGGVCQ